ncbi:iron-sulfur cluster assembly protein [Pedobacter sp. MR2016-24]|uniref:iron-sulfur cluster assembly protein n=1 Tax=Pedobacter sp. MR2016-24 TaxID=2994466 RepID=UPI002245424C|nr:iron-sulfur cluster assembly protein [Pedobacter sp. MR2016-24]MCX2485631.1 iron-sulfur cluster assembly protein [Pedobacter sp. MR2016-24]
MTELSLRDKIEAALHTIYDPEIPVDIFELGLIYKIQMMENDGVHIYMTLTAPACPAAGEILNEVETKVKAIDGIGEVEVRLTFDPPWDREMMSDEARLELGWL